MAVSREERAFDPSARDRDALRLLFILRFAGAEPSRGSRAVSRIIGQMRLQAMDFWVRNPDYLADELLNEFQATADRTQLELAARILDSDEPELRRIPMIRWLHGAFERLDDAFAVLRAAGLADLEIRRTVRSVRGYEYLLLPAGAPAVDGLLQDHPELDWYRERALVVRGLAGAAGGTALKARQYRQATYGNTPLGNPIPGIADRVRARLEEMRTR